MALAKKRHNKSYMRRYNVKYRRRRQCKTNYRKRARLVAQYKNKYGTPKFRLVVRKTNRDIICQVFSSDMTHDICLAAAYSHELKRYGVTAGFTNYPAAYCVGLLLARRLIKKLEKSNEGVGEVDGDFYLDDESDAFRAFLDTGLARCSTGANIFGVLKGAVDGGLNVPHNTRRFPGSTKEDVNGDGKKQWQYEPEIHKNRIFGHHISEYMTELKNNDEEKYKKHFRKFIEAKIEPEDVEKMYRKAHEKIRANPSIERCPKERGYFKPDRKEDRKPAEYYEANQKKYNKRKLTGKERKINAIKKIKEIKEAKVNA